MLLIVHTAWRWRQFFICSGVKQSAIAARSQPRDLSIMFTTVIKSFGGVSTLYNYLQERCEPFVEKIEIVFRLVSFPMSGCGRARRRCRNLFMVRLETYCFASVLRTSYAFVVLVHCEICRTFRSYGLGHTPYCSEDTTVVNTLAFLSLHHNANQLFRTFLLPIIHCVSLEMTVLSLHCRSRRIAGGYQPALSAHKGPNKLLEDNSHAKCNYVVTESIINI